MRPKLSWTQPADLEIVEYGHETAKDDVHERQGSAGPDGAEDGDGIEVPAIPVGVFEDSLRMGLHVSRSVCVYPWIISDTYAGVRAGDSAGNENESKRVGTGRVGSGQGLQRDM